MTPAFWQGRRVFITGHTGFKGSWLTFWLQRLGAVVNGYALAPDTNPSLFDALGLSGMSGKFADIRDAREITSAMQNFAPEIVLHLAAQALVLASYEDPVGTFATNVIGTATVLDAVRHTPSVNAVVIVTSDKCYENLERWQGYSETDGLGGADPYSASKGAAELITSSFRRSFFAPYCQNGHHARIATVRAGNVIGGGDWSSNRLIPDIIRNCLTEAGVVTLRSPGATRPWQHVLEPLSAYLGLAERLCTDAAGIDGPFNIGPAEENTRTVLEVTQALIASLGEGRIANDERIHPHEAHSLRLDCTKAVSVLGWQPRLDFATTIAMTADWYRRFHNGEDARTITAQQLDLFESLAPHQDLS